VVQAHAPAKRKPAKPVRLSGNFAARRMPEMSDPDEANFVKF
jgi:methyl-accepting chemotaxis protein